MKMYEQISLTAKHAAEIEQEAIYSNYFSRTRENEQLALKGFFANFLKIFKDFVKPYKNNMQMMGDLLSGLKNLPFLITGIGAIAFSIGYFFGMFAAGTNKAPLKFAGDALKASAFSLVAGVALLTMGILTLALWPLTIVRMPIRSIITWQTNKNKLCAEYNTGYQRLITLYDAQATPVEQKRIAATMIAKAFIDIDQKNQKTRATKENITYVRDQYHSLFGKGNPFPQTVTTIDKKEIDHVKVVRLFKELRANREDDIKNHLSAGPNKNRR